MIEALVSKEFIDSNVGAWWGGFREGGASQFNPCRSDDESLHAFYPNIRVKDTKHPERLLRLCKAFGGNIIRDGSLWSLSDRSALMRILLATQGYAPNNEWEIRRMVVAVRDDVEEFNNYEKDVIRLLYRSTVKELYESYRYLVKNRFFVTGFFEGGMGEVVFTKRNRFRIDSTSSNLPLLETFWGEFGGSFSLESSVGEVFRVNGRKMVAGKNIYRWTLNETKTFDFLQLIDSCLLIKKVSSSLY